MLDPGLRAEPLAPVGEGVGGDVHHAHDQAPSRVGKPRRAGCPGRVDDHGVTLRGPLPAPPPRPPRRRARLSLSRRRFPGTGQSPRSAHVARESRPDGPLLLERGGAPDTSRGRAPEPDNSPVAAHVAREVSPRARLADGCGTGRARVIGRPGRRVRWAGGTRLTRPAGAGPCPARAGAPSRRISSFGHTRKASASRAARATRGASEAPGKTKNRGTQTGANLALNLYSDSIWNQREANSRIRAPQPEHRPGTDPLAALQRGPEHGEVQRDALDPQRLGGLDRLHDEEIVDPRLG